MNHPIIYIGCGGTGLKILEKVAKTFSADPSLRNQAQYETFFVLVDTEIKQINKTAEWIRSLIPGLQSEHICKIHLTKDATRLFELIDKTIISPNKQLTEEQFNRLKDYWWFDNNKKPFLAEKVFNIQVGAGQCPPVSFFAAWFSISYIGREFERLLRFIERIRGGLQPENEIAAHLITGLAGGTGRGCWALLALEIQDTFNRIYGRVLNVTGVFLDASITLEKQQLQAMRNGTQVNALTGFSEISYWASIPDHQNPKFFLPSLQRPEDPNADEIRIEYLGRVKPITVANLIFQNPKNSAPLNNIEEYYEMVSRALYCEKKYFQVNSKLVNNGNYFGSYAAASAEVPIPQIRSYLEGLMYIHFTENLSFLNDDSHCQQSVIQFLQDYKLLNIQVSLPDASYYIPTSNNYDHDNFIQNVAENFLKRQEPQLATLRNALGKQHIEEAQECMEEICNFSPNETDCLEAVKQTISLAYKKLSQKGELSPTYTPHENFKEIVKEYANKIFLQESQWPSLASITHFYNLLQNWLTSENCPFSSFPDHPPAGLAEAPNEFRDAFFRFKKKEMLLWGPAFNDAEIEKLIDLAKLAILSLSFSKLCDIIKKTLHESFQFENVEFNNYLNAVAEVKQLFIAELEEKFDGTKFQKIHDLVFVNPSEPEKSLPQNDETSHFILKNLRPYRTREDVQTLLAQEIEKQKASANEIVRWIINVIEGNTPGVNNFKLNLRDKIKSTLKISHDLDEKEFNIGKVLYEIHHYWEYRFNNLNIPNDNFQSISNLFRKFFGSTPHLAQDGKYYLPSDQESRIKDFILNFITNLACNISPFWAIDNSSTDKINYSIFMPNFSKRTEEFHLEKDQVIQKMNPDKTNAEVYFDDESDRSVNPFVISILSWEGIGSLDKVRSLDYYKNGEILNLLEKAEQPGEHNLIFQEVDHGINGVTYCMPIFVNNENFRKNRWRPWFKESQLQNLPDKPQDKLKA